MKPGVVRIVAIVLVVGLLVGGGVLAAVTALHADDAAGGSSRSSGPAPTTTPSPGATKPPRAALAAFYGQRLAWKPCQDSFECATLTVPLDYAKPDGETIDLALLKVPAADPSAREGSLVVNPGGPGQPGTGYAASAKDVFRQPLLDHFDIVGFDPRGTGQSDPVDCLSDAALDTYVAGDPNPDTPAEVRAYEDSVQALGAGCVKLSGDLASHISTIEAARDMDVLRAALGESKLTYLGASYGTKLGATYAELFPKQVGRLVLDGAVDLSISSRELSLEQAAGFETALRAYVQNCLDSADDCFLGDTVEEGLTKIRDFLGQVEDQPLDTSTDRELAAGQAFYGIVLPLYSRDNWYILSQALKQGFSGDGSTLLLLADLYSSRSQDGGYDDNSLEANYAINCLDDPYAISADQVPANEPDFEKASPTFGDVFAWSLTTCGGVVARTTEKPITVRGEGAAPIVVVGTTRDPATPYQWAVHLADQLASGVLVSRDGDGHTGYNSGNACVDDAVEGYLIDGTVPKDGLSC
ncbi:alpha/beta fold hydrolase [Nocardioides sp. KIGAM211]|uniref:Alpha/beta fold hydrolase n=1 Tax=Nocardioides luti TaxID=2761101 RepID=A0A7X0RG61_9ACTN|nr:alpha/beta hydrolase [Nocardioides luti]MBB6627617.1 alpha/beta fold hydrolase [Nocardioides luti]